MPQQFFRVANWDRFQHYKDRNPPWIKLYTALLDNYDFTRLQDASKSHLISIWMIASRNSNRLPLDEKWIASRIFATEPVDLEQLIAGGFLEKISSENNMLQSSDQAASCVLATRKQSARPETETETETETEKKEPSDAIASAPSKVSPALRGTRLPQGFAITEEHRKFANEIGVDVDHEFAIFRDYWIAQPGQKGIKTEWNATFRNWLRRATETQNRNGHGGRNGKPSIGEIVEREQAILRSRSPAQ